MFKTTMKYIYVDTIRPRIMRFLDFGDNSSQN